MQIQVFESSKQIGRAAAAIVAAQLLSKPNSVLGLATGSSPIPTYRELIKLYQEKVIDFSCATSFNLDEYCGIPVVHPCSYHQFMKDELFDHVNFAPAHTHVPDGNAADMSAECERYDNAILAAGGIDLQLLGIGRNGHIGFNEPSDRFVYGCHVVTLTQSTIDANRRFFEGEFDVPHEAISLGVGAIMRARKVLLIATGEDKAEAICRAVKGDIHPETQASLLRTHADVLFLLDEAAASGL